MVLPHNCTTTVDKSEVPQGKTAPQGALTKARRAAKLPAMRRYYLWAIGCQMNDADAARVREGLQEAGFALASDPGQADLVVLITCVVRQSAEDKVVGRLTSLKNWRRRNPQTALLVMGCFVHDACQQEKRFPYVDAFFGPSDISGLLEWVRQRWPEGTGERSMEIPKRATVAPVSALVPLSYGCDHHCTYCIVRLRRGGQQSRPLTDVLSDVRDQVQRSAREVVLLGQNVDAYAQDLGPGAPDLADVLTAMHEIEGLWRIRFLTSHPGHMTPKLIRTVAQLPRVCPHFELPVQSGDDVILRRMGRNYTVAQYRELVASIRDRVPGCSLATDVIVGFPGEDEAQFHGTHDLLASLRFDAVHIAKYSPRPGTPAARLADDVPVEEKERRRALLEQLQTQIAGEINATLRGGTVEVLVEERRRGKWRGRTVTNKLVFFEDAEDWRGHPATVKITWTGPWSMQGEVMLPQM
jgi:tRNA-2-methylthio-N6-dimethylallyladenosine synthase